jgi:hypothetical protein
MIVNRKNYATVELPFKIFWLNTFLLIDWRRSTINKIIALLSANQNSVTLSM